MKRRGRQPNVHPYWIVTAPGGSGLKDAVARLVHDLGMRLDPKYGVIVQDVEEELCTLAGGRGLVDGSRVSMLEVTHKLQREQVVRLWGEALDISLSKLAASPARAKLLSCHLTLYGGRRREHYSPVDVARLVSGPLKPSRLLLLVDDAFDMFARLTQPGYLYDFGAADYIDEVAMREGISSDATLDSVRSQLKLEWQIATLSSLLFWRRADMVLAESLARQTGARYLAFGVKQSTAVAARWLSEVDAEATYLSHSISRPRRDPKWPNVDLVREFTEVQSGLEPHRTLCIMPTSIDEYRFQRKKVRGRPMAKLQPRLTDRWPIPTALALIDKSPAYSDTLYVAPSSGPKLKNLFEHKNVDELAVDSWLRSFEGLVSADISFRDHHLVACCPHLMVFRPLYLAGTFSRGVEAEITHWHLLASDRPAGSARRGVFVHFLDDIAALRTAGIGSIEASVRRILESKLTEAGLTPTSARRVVRVASPDSPGRSLLDTGLMTPIERRMARKSWPKIRRGAILGAAWERLTSIMAGKSMEAVEMQVGIWIVADMVELRREYASIAAFLKGKRPGPTTWRKVGVSLLDADAIPSTLRT